MGENFACTFEYSLARGATGVYLLRLRGVVVYVGQSLNLFARVAQHWQGMVRQRKGKLPYSTGNGYPVQVIEFDHVEAFYCPKKDLDKRELELIQQHLPERNTLMKRKPFPELKLSELPFFQVLKEHKIAPQPTVKRRKTSVRSMLADRELRKTTRKVRITLGGLHHVNGS